MSVSTQSILPLKMRVATASKMFDVGKSTLWNLIKEGKIKAYRPSEKITLLETKELIEYFRGKGK